MPLPEGPCHVLLVEDDPSLQRFVAMALEDEVVQLRAVPSVDEALAVLRAGPVDLVLTDLMLPGRHGTELLALLQQDAHLRGPARVAVFSAGLTAQVRQQLAGLDVWRFISKPCRVAELVDCVQALQAGTGPAADAAPRSTAAPTEGDGSAHPHAAAITAHFAGQAALYDAFRAQCLAQFPHDLAAGQQACEQADASRLQHLAHSLKSVLLTLGHESASGLARQLEHDAATPAPWPALRAQWSALAGQLSLLR